MARCTKSSLMTYDGQIEFDRFAVFAETLEGAIVRVQDALALRHATFSAKRVRLVQVPLSGDQAPVPPTAAQMAGDAPLPCGAYRRFTDRDRAAGAGHVDRPRSDAERTARRKQVDKLLNRAGATLKLPPQKRADATRRHAPALLQLCEQIGTFEVSQQLEQLLADGEVASHRDLLDALGQLPTMAQRAGAPDPTAGQQTGPAGTPPSPALASLNAQVGAPPARPVVTSPSDIADHALLRFFERVDGNLGADHVELARAAAHAAAAGDATEARHRRQQLKRALAAAAVTADKWQAAAKFLAKQVSARSQLPAGHPAGWLFSPLSAGPATGGSASRFVIEGHVQAANGQDAPLCLVMDAQTDLGRSGGADRGVRASVVSCFYRSKTYQGDIWDGMVDAGEQIGGRSARSTIEQLLADTIQQTR